MLAKARILYLIFNDFVTDIFADPRRNICYESVNTL
jgi:hypothetical protein